MVKTNKAELIKEIEKIYMYAFKQFDELIEHTKDPIMKLEAIGWAVGRMNNDRIEALKKAEFTEIRNKTLDAVMEQMLGDMKHKSKKIAVQKALINTLKEKLSEYTIEKL